MRLGSPTSTMESDNMARSQEFADTPKSMHQEACVDMDKKHTLAISSKGSSLGRKGATSVGSSTSLLMFSMIRAH
jgi:hypothetical protein